MSNQLKIRTSKVCVNNRFVGPAATHVEAERKAQAYVANGETIKRQNAAVMKAYYKISLPNGATLA